MDGIHVQGEELQRGCFLLLMKMVQTYKKMLELSFFFLFSIYISIPAHACKQNNLFTTVTMMSLSS